MIEQKWRNSYFFSILKCGQVRPQNLVKISLLTRRSTSGYKAKTQKWPLKYFQDLILSLKAETRWLEEFHNFQRLIDFSYTHVKNAFAVREGKPLKSLR